MTGVHDSVDLLFRRHAGRLTATLARILGFERIDLVEDVVQDAFVQALRTWPFAGVPDHPRAWILRVAKNRAIDALRREGALQERWDAIERATVPDPAPAAGPARFSDELDDDRLRLVFACCHPALGRDAQVALTLKTAAGFGVDEIARAFLARPATVAQRIVRAKRTLRESAVTLEIPTGARLAAHRAAVLEVLYLLFNEGYAASAGEDLVRSELCAEAIGMAESMARHPATGGPAVHALAALLLYQAARLPARLDASGELVRLERQDRSLWDRESLSRATAHLARSAAGDELTSYHLQAEIASCHALAPSWEATDWERILAAYDALVEIDRSPVVALNRVVAVARVEGLEAARRALAPLADDPALRAYEPRFAVEGDLLERAGRPREAAAAFRRAAALSRSEPVRRHLERRVRRLESGPAGRA